MQRPLDFYAVTDHAMFMGLVKEAADTSTEFSRYPIAEPLHDINPLRLNFINTSSPLAGKRVLDVGCGGGILCESMAECGADVTATRDHDPFIRLINLPPFSGHSADVFLCGDEKHLVIWLNDGSAFGDDGL